MHSLRFKILAVAAALVILSQLATVTTVLFTARNDVADRASESLENGATIIRKATLSQAKQFESTVNALAADYAFKQAVATGDTATADSALKNHARRAGADIALLFDIDQRISASTTATDFAAEQTESIFSKLSAVEPSWTVVLHNEIAYEIITVPVRAPLEIAWLSMGFALDDGYAQKLADLAGQDVSLLIADRSGPRIAASTLAPELMTSLAAQAGASRLAMQSTTIELENAEHLLLKTRFIDNQDLLWVVLSESLADAMAPYRILQTAAFALGALPLIAALLGALLLSRALTRPVQTLMQAASRIQAGDYSTKVEIRSGDELNQFAAAFNAMQVEIAQREERISFQAQHDSVTGLYNRDYALQILNQKMAAAPEGSRLALLIVSLNAADEISGTLGHDIADQYQQKAAAKLEMLVDSSHVLAHVKGDTFLIILQDTGATDARCMAEELIARLKPGIAVADVSIAISPTVGIAVYPDHGNDRERLLKRATIALEANSERRRPVRFYREGDEEARIRNMTLLQDLRRAVDNNELQLHYQPKIAIADETVCGAEALVRWQHPNYGWLTPDKFVPIIERSGNISILTQWVLETAAHQYQQWKQAGLDMHIAINFSALDIQDRDLPWHVMDALRAANMPAEKLVAEITEEAMVRDFSNAITVLRHLRDLGISISIDDFGTGYSSLSQLKNLPVNELKIDRSFIANLPDDQSDVAIVSASIELAKKLGLDIVAEGVASGAILRWLQAQGVERGQGFYWSPGLPGNEFEIWTSHFSGGSTRQVKALEVIESA